MEPRMEKMGGLGVLFSGGTSSVRTGGSTESSASLSADSNAEADHRLLCTYAPASWARLSVSSRTLFLSCLIPSPRTADIFTVE